MGRPAGWHSVTPRLIADDPSTLVRFLKAAFGASGDFQSERPSEMLVGDSMVMVSGSAETRPATRGYFYLYVEDADAAFQKALRAGAAAVEPPVEVPWGDRRATIEDPAGNTWQIASRK